MRPRIHVLNSILTSRREQLGLTQSKAAELLGVDRRRLAVWECEAAPIAPKFLAAFARVYGIPRSELDALHDAKPAGRPFLDDLPGLPSSATRMVAYEVHGTLEGMLTYGPVAREVHLDTEARLGSSLYRDFLHSFPRDSALELLKAHRLLCAGESSLRILRPLDNLGWLFPMVGRNDDQSVSQRLHYVVDVTDGELRLLAVSQVTLLTRRITGHARLDFLAQISDGTSTAFVDLEVDGDHENSSDRDQQRALGLGLIRVPFTRQDICNRNYDERIWTRLRETLAWASRRK